jgi:predicted CopG family antitoxin
MEPNMTKTITIPEDLYHELEQSAQSRRLSNIVQVIRVLLEQSRADELKQRRNAGQAILDLHERMKIKYGPVDDSTDLIRQDREREQ